MRTGRIGLLTLLTGQLAAMSAATVIARTFHWLFALVPVRFWSKLGSATTGRFFFNKVAEPDRLSLAATCTECSNIVFY